MDDLIKRQDAIDVVEKWFNKIELNGDICIDGLISLPPAQKWIPVSRRLPKNDEDVLVCFPQGGMAVAYYHIDDTYYPAQYIDLNETGWFNEEGDAFDFDPIAWIPLPEPYKESEEEMTREESKAVETLKITLPYDSDFAEANIIAIRAIQNASSAQQWIPCSERLPEKEGQYLVTLDFAWGKKIEMGDWFIFWDGHGEWVNPNSHVTVAWMELPTPWKESEDKE